LIPEEKLARMTADVKQILRYHPGGLGEHKLFQLLHDYGHSEFAVDTIRNPKELYVSHFLLFHCLYRLSNELCGQGLYLDINPVKIRLFPSSNTGSNAVASHDVMAAFYLDLDNIDAMSDKQIHDMLGGFWQRYFAKDERQSALAELNLGPDADYDDIRSRYRELAREHHPDRGGEHDRFQRINRAMETLKKYYGK
jgi:hypothetical protein